MGKSHSSSSRVTLIPKRTKTLQLDFPQAPHLTREQATTIFNRTEGMGMGMGMGVRYLTLVPGRFLLHPTNGTSSTDLGRLQLSRPSNDSKVHVLHLSGKLGTRTEICTKEWNPSSVRKVHTSNENAVASTKCLRLKAECVACMSSEWGRYRRLTYLSNTRYTIVRFLTTWK